MSDNAKQLKDRVASFRIPRSIDDQVEAQLKDKPIVGCNTANKFYRKLALDWMDGRLAYKNPSDRDSDPEVLAAMESIPGDEPVAA